MSAFAQLPSGILAPTQIAHSVMHDILFGNHGAYRTASAGNKNTVGWVTSDGSADADTLAGRYAATGAKGIAKFYE